MDDYGNDLWPVYCDNEAMFYTAWDFFQQSH